MRKIIPSHLVFYVTVCKTAQLGHFATSMYKAKPHALPRRDALARSVQSERKCLGTVALAKETSKYVQQSWA